ncbi:hypothetical protein JXI42_03240 [bacterium]|nr:hypothetical protein [bacterium]
MKKLYRLLSYLSILIILLIGLNYLYAKEKEIPTLTRREAFIKALSGIKMTINDVTIVKDTEPDPYRLSIVDFCMQNPLQAVDSVNQISARLSNTGENELNILLEATRLMNLDTKNPVIATESRAYPWEGVVKLSKKILSAMNLIYDSYERGTKNIEDVFAEIDSFQLDTLETRATLFLIQSETDIEDLDLETEQKEINYEELIRTDDEIAMLEKLEERFFSILSEVDRKKMAEISIDLFYSVLEAKSLIEDLNISESFTNNDSISFEGVEGDILYIGETPYGLVVVGGPEKTIYKVPTALIIDLGGDDEYYCNAGGTVEKTRFSVSLDLSGDDLYKSDKDFAFGSGNFGVGILLDLDGDDFYSSNNFGIAAGVIGTGILIDYEGNDNYAGNTATIGAGFAGWGILSELKGHDKYVGNLFCQGFGYVAGFGAVNDKMGNDIYIAQGRYLDDIRYADHFLSLSQGFGYGSRPDWSGGIGFIIDEKGNDSYVSDIYGQGSSYWYSLGALIDRDGNDNYTSYQYAQGNGTHNTVGFLIEENGNDSYISHGVSQGCGHDAALGYLLDKKGNDNYIIWDLSQGAGNSNGIGIFVDEEGDDSYIAKKTYNTQGYGNYRHEFGSIGVFLDLKGEDDFAGPGKDKSWWSLGKYGIGVDFPTEVKTDENNNSIK